MAEDFLKPKGIKTGDLERRRMEDGQFRNPPTYMQLSGFTSADKSMFQRNKMTLEKGGPSAIKGRPI